MIVGGASPIDEISVEFIEGKVVLPVGHPSTEALTILHHYPQLLRTADRLTGMLNNMLIQSFGPGLPVLALLFIGTVVEKYYGSRVTVLSNTIALNGSFLSLDKDRRSSC